MGGFSIDDGPENVDEFMRERKGSCA